MQISQTASKNLPKKFKNYFNGAEYKRNLVKSRKVLKKFLLSNTFQIATERQKRAMLHRMRNILASPNFTDFETCRAVAAHLEIGKTTEAEARNLMLSSGLFENDKVFLNKRRFQILIRPAGLEGYVAFVKKKHLDYKYFETRVFSLQGMSDEEFIRSFFTFEPDTTKISKTGNGYSVGLLYGCDPALLLTDSAKLEDAVLKRKDLCKLYLQNRKTRKVEKPVLEAPKADIREDLENLGFYTFSIQKDSKILKLKASSVKAMGKQRRLNWTGNEIYEREMYDVGTFLRVKLVCLDADDAESFKVLCAVLPEKTLAQLNIKNGHGHIFLSDKKGLLKDYNKIGNVDVIQGNKGVRVICDDYEWISGDLNNLVELSEEMCNNLLMFLPGSQPERVKICFTSQNTGFNATQSENIPQIANNVVDVLRGVDSVKFKIAEGTRNITLLKTLALLRARGYTADVLTDAAELIDKDFFDAKDSCGKTSATLKSILRGKNKANFVQHVPMFSRSL
jgi:hypothetical protein